MAQEPDGNKPLALGILGYGGLGQAMAQLVARRQSVRWVAVADRKGYGVHPDGLNPLSCQRVYQERGSVGYLEPGGVLSETSLAEIIPQPGVNAYFLALPNLPNTFIASVVQQFLAQGWRGVLVDAIKRTSAVEQLCNLKPALVAGGITYLTGCGATPGLLTAAAALAAHSFEEILQITITFGVGIANWEAYRATIREDIAHLPGYDPAQAQAMSDGDIEALLAQTDGKLYLENMEHADDVILELAGICPRQRVTVGGVVDTRNPRKPLSTNVQITGRTFENKIATHTFTLGDETSMAANVCGPALGYLQAGWQLHQQGHFGLFTCAEVMPRWVS
ncbi:hypothetical protein GlitD10_1763 [Gloeomargarita lithophora Alchichica-D10]|uniref:(S)-8-amino-7-oxononanoate synthase BioU n=1 Tax=Gloeomargarita lithophora Alchichica-D10 TaxID=1188229 RepID=A0A1J0ADT8_9CYAN|nr:saccharopine dehydrogenase-like oxidoreductase [Gloeomargarita lithophora]APB34089.1 hypothetical protein GlitD10_1763 [Gloeomargarita lithophora Alchichica-D10]